MVVTKHFAVHSTKYRKSLIKYILNPDKTEQLKLVSDFGMSNYLDFPTYEELVEMYQANLTNNDRLYDSRNDRQQIKQTKIHAHHLIQSFSPEDNLTAEEINRIGYETIKELTGGNFRFIVATHIDRDHVHNHILINSVDLHSDKKLKWDYAQERNLRMISDRIAKEAGAKIIPPNRYSHEQFVTYRKTNHKFELKQRLYFLMENSKNFEDFMAKAPALNVEVDFSRKHARFFMTDRDMKQVIRDHQLDKRQPYTEVYFREQFAKRAIEQRLDFLLPRARDLSHLLEMAEQLNLKISPKKKHVTFTLTEDDRIISIENKKVSTKHLYDVQFFEDYFDKRESTPEPDLANLVSDFKNYQEEQDQDKLPTDELLVAYKEFKEKRDQIHEFEVVLADHQIEKLVDKGIYIKVSFGVKQSGLIFIPNCQLDILEKDNQKTYRVYIRETTLYFVYNKLHSYKNQYIKGRSLIRQLTNNSRNIPYRRPTVGSIQEKIYEISFLIELNETDKKYQEIKDELVKEIAKLDIELNQANEKIATLNKMAEVFINLKSEVASNRTLARYDFSKLNLTESISLENVNEELRVLKEETGHYINEFEALVRRLETFVKLLNTENLFLASVSLVNTGSEKYSNQKSKDNLLIE